MPGDVQEQFVCRTFQSSSQQQQPLTEVSGGGDAGNTTDCMSLFPVVVGFPVEQDQASAVVSTAGYDISFFNPALGRHAHPTCVPFRKRFLCVLLMGEHAC